MQTALVGEPHVQASRASAVEWTATVRMPISRQARMIAERDLAAVGDQDLVEHRAAALER